MQCSFCLSDNRLSRKLRKGNVEMLAERVYDISVYAAGTQFTAHNHFYPLAIDVARRRVPENAQIFDNVMSQQCAGRPLLLRVNAIVTGPPKAANDRYVVCVFISLLADFQWQSIICMHLLSQDLYVSNFKRLLKTFPLQKMAQGAH